MSGWGKWLARTRLAGLPAGERAEALAGLAATRDRLLDGAGLESGDDVLDPGPGAGLLTFGALERIGEGWVYAVDPSVDTLERLLTAAHETGQAGVAYLVGDVAVLPLPDSSIDACVGRSALAADASAAAQELYRVLRPGGRVSLCESGAPDGAAFLAGIDWAPPGEELAGRASAELDARAASGPAPPPDPDELARALSGAGFDTVEADVDAAVEEVELEAEAIERWLDGRGPDGAPSPRERWTGAFTAAEAERLAAHVRSLAGTTRTVRRPAAWLRARKA